MKYLLPIILCFIVACSGNHQTDKATTKPVIDSIQKDSISIKKHLFTDLSKLNNYNLTFYTKYKHQNTEEYYCVIKIFDKKTNVVIDSIRQDMSTLLLADTLVDTRSFITGKDEKKEVQDNFYGTLVVADFNFDKKEDFAIMNDVGASTGGIYTYYIQTGDNKFLVDTFLTNTMTFFPDSIDPVNKILITYVHANAYEMAENTYKLNIKTQKWKLIKHRLLPFSE